MPREGRRSRTSQWRHSKNVIQTYHSSTLNSSLNLRPQRPEIGLLNSVTGEENSGNLSSPNESMNMVENIPLNSLTSGEKMLTDIKELFLSHRNIPNVFLSDLLKVLKEHPCFSNFPEDARTLLNTEKNIRDKIITIEPGRYCHFGIAEGISIVYKDILTQLNKIELVVGIDGLPLTKSTNSCFWPILGYVEPHKTRIFIIGLYHGYEKPKSSNDFLSHFVNESMDLEKNGFRIETNTIISFSIRAFCLDAPAKAFLLNIKGHSGFSSCTRCDCKGIHLVNRMSFPTKVMKKRTHEEFLNKTDSSYHLEGDITILSKLNVNLVNSIPLDYMHLVCLGIVKKLLLLLINKAPVHLRISKSKHNSLNISKYDTINSSLILCATMIPVEFNRTCRTLDLISRWKATELRTFLLYVGIIVLHDNISEKQYENFLSLNVALTILLSPNLGHLANFAHDLLKYFVVSFSRIYGKHLVSHNVHGLLHLIEDYNQFGPLDNCNAFCFENFLQVIKKKIRKPEKPLEQILKRYSEEPFNVKNDIEYSTKEVLLLKPHKKGPVLEGIGIISHQFDKLRMNSFTFRRKTNNSKKNCYFISARNEVVEIHNFVKIHGINDEFVILGYSFETTDWYEKPLKSSLLHIFKIGELCTDMKVWYARDIVKKCMILETNKKIRVALPLVHSLV